MNKTFFTSDQHFGHANIINLCNRPFDNVHQMDKYMIKQWNDVVSDNDIVYHLGDFGYKASVDYLEEVMQRLNGYIIFIRGNHDTNTIKANDRCNRFDSVHERLETDIDDVHFVLDHYPLLEWAGYYRGSWNLFGHVHGNLLPSQISPRQADVGVDVWDRPITFEQIINKQS